jgi:propionyl-CoA carboxylase alpha chain
MQHEAFRSGNFDTKFIERYFQPELLTPQPAAEEIEIAAVLAAYLFETTKPQTIIDSREKTSAPVSSWKKNRLKL